MPESRRLAAIMFTDIVGYTRLMNQDEQLALSLLTNNREIHKRLIAKNKGDFIKEMGDGVMASFNTSSDAVSCAKEIQKACIEKGIHLRIGINQGEVTFQDGDVFGDGVNIASHIESLGQSDAILLSKASNRQLANKPSFKTKFIGRFKLKKLEEAIEVYALVGEGLVVPKKAELLKKGGTLIYDKMGSKRLSTFLILTISIIGVIYLVSVLNNADKPTSENEHVEQNIINPNSIAVLPFRNMSGQKNQDYFAEGMMEEVLNRLFQIQDLNVISRTTSMKYKDSNLSASEIAQELGVANIMEGSVRMDKNNVRVSVKLIDGQNDIQKWLHTYDSELKGIFVMQGDIAKKVAAYLEVQINPETKSRIENGPTEDPEVWKLFMRAKHVLAFTNDIQKADELLEEAIFIDKNFAPGYAELGFHWLSRGNFEGDLAADQLLDSAYYYLNEAKRINPNYPTTHVYLAELNLWFKWDFEGAEKEWNAFYKLSPSDQSNDPGYLDFLNASGRFEESLSISNKMLKSDASSSANWSTSGLSFYFSGQEEKAVKHYEEALEIFPISSIVSDAGRTFVYTKNYKKAIDLLHEVYDKPIESNPRAQGNLAISYYHVDEKEKADKLLNVLKEKAEENPAGSPAFYTAMVLTQMGKFDEAFSYLEKAFENREVEMFWLNVEPPFQPLRGDDRWNLLLEKVGFSTIRK